MLRFAWLILLPGTLYAAQPGVDFETAATVYQAAAGREQVRASLASMPEKVRRLYTADDSSTLSDEHLAAVESGAKYGFRIDVFEPPAIAALAIGLTPAAARESLEFLHGSAGQHMVAADVALAQADDATQDRIASGELAAPASAEREALFDRIAIATSSVDSAVQIYLAIARGLAMGTAIGSGTDPIAAEQRVARKADAATRADIAARMRDPLRRSVAYGYRELSTADLRRMLAFFGTKSGQTYVSAYVAAMNAGFDAMARRCGERIGERWREILAAQHAKQPSLAPLPAPAGSP
jgi:hypothetical protein